jgi:hypothetical protein
MRVSDLAIRLVITTALESQMNPDLVYARYRDDALVQQFVSEKYTTFVAKPFVERHSYRSKEIFENVISAAVDRANRMVPTKGLPRKFAPPDRVDKKPGVARQITDEILKDILYAHFVVADLTMSNDGVYLEVGVSLALKPNDRITLITQGRPEELHFDIKGKNTVFYNRPDHLDQIAEALCESARSFEDDRGRYLTQLSSQLTADAVFVLNWYGQCQSRPRAQRSALHEDTPPPWFAPAPGNQALSISGVDVYGTRARMTAAIRELMEKGMFRNDYRAQQRTDSGAVAEMWSYHATDLGWAFIEYMWPACDGNPGLHRPSD